MSDATTVCSQPADARAREAVTSMMHWCAFLLESSGTVTATGRSAAGAAMARNVVAAALGAAAAVPGGAIDVRTNDGTKERDFCNAAGFCDVEKVRDFGLFNDTSAVAFRGERLALNVVARACRKEGQAITVQFPGMET